MPYTVVALSRKEVENLRQLSAVRVLTQAQNLQDKLADALSEHMTPAQRAEWPGGELAQDLLYHQEELMTLREPAERLADACRQQPEPPPGGEDLEQVQGLLLHTLRAGCAMLDRLERALRQVPSALTLQEEERAYKRVAAHGFAAQALLGGVPELHSALVEHPDFMRLRAVMRAWG